MSVPTRRILRSIFGLPTLEGGGDGKATWTRSLTPGTNRVAWAAKLDAGKQTSWNDYAKVIIPVNELDFTDLEIVRLMSYYTVATGADMAVTVYMHDPNDLDQYIELSHTPLTNAGAGYRELNFPTEPGGSSWGWYGNVTDTPNTCPSDWDTASYTWAQFQADSVFSTWTIYRISLDYGYQTGDIVLNGGYLCQALINNVSILLEPSLEEQFALLRDETANAIKTVPTWLFGEPTLTAAQNGDAVWSRASGVATVAAYQKGSTGWLANLYGGVQTGGKSFGAVYIPVNELPLSDLSSALWTYYFTAAEEHGVNMVIWIHDPDDNDRRVEITQAPSHADLERASGWNAHELSLSTTQFWYYGEIVGAGTPDTTPTAGTQYTLAQFQADSVFSRYTIYRISFEYGWYSTGTFDDAWVADIKINDQVIRLKPDSGGSGRIGHRRLELTSGDVLLTLAPKTRFRLLSLSVHVDAIPADGKPFTATVDSIIEDGTDAAHFDTLIMSVDMFDDSATSLFRAFGEGYDFGDTEEIDFEADNDTENNDYGIVVTYQTVFGGM